MRINSKPIEIFICFLLILFACLLLTVPAFASSVDVSVSVPVAEDENITDDSRAAADEGADADESTHVSSDISVSISSSEDDSSAILSESTSTSDIAPVALENEPRPFLTTPLDDYTVVEGFLLIIVVFVGLAAIILLFRGKR